MTPVEIEQRWEQVWVFSETLCQDFDKEMKCATSISLWGSRSNEPPHSCIWFCLDSLTFFPPCPSPFFSFLLFPFSHSSPILSFFSPPLLCATTFLSAYPLRLLIFSMMVAQSHAFAKGKQQRPRLAPPTMAFLSFFCLHRGSQRAALLIPVNPEVDLAAYVNVTSYNSLFLSAALLWWPDEFFFSLPSWLNPTGIELLSALCEWNVNQRNHGAHQKSSEPLSAHSILQMLRQSHPNCWLGAVRRRIETSTRFSYDS